LIPDYSEKSFNMMEEGFKEAVPGFQFTKEMREALREAQRQETKSLIGLRRLVSDCGLQLCPTNPCQKLRL